MSLAYSNKLLLSGKGIFYSRSCNRTCCCSFCSVAVIKDSNQKQLGDGGRGVF